MKLVSSEQMQAIDRRAIDGLGIPGLELMENAGRGIADYIKELLTSETRDKKIAIFCGKGNNGGDGFVIARYLQSWGASVEIFIFSDPSQFKGDALVNYQKIADLDLQITEIASPEFRPKISGVDLIVDAIFGTGFSGTIRGTIADTVEFVNNSQIPVVAVDTPSGLNSDTGEVTGPCIRANHTVTMALPKVGQYFHPGKQYCGQIRVIDIGIPDQAIPYDDLPLNLITASLVKRLIPDRDPACHKGDCGKLFILAGSVGMTGAATLAAESAVKSGAGLVYVGLPRSLNDIVEVKLTEALTKPLPELRKRRCLSLRALGQVLENVRATDAACLGPGVGRHFETIELFQRLIPKLEKPAVLDADGLFPFGGKPELLKQSKADIVLTPHVGEFAHLVGSTIEEIEKNRIRLLTEYASNIDKVVLLKGAPTLIASPEGNLFLSPTGNPGMATGGSGDVLTGIIGSLLALGLRGIDAAICGAYIHGFAGDLARKSAGTFGLTATDIAVLLPRTLKILKD